MWSSAGLSPHIGITGRSNSYSSYLGTPANEGNALDAFEGLSQLLELITAAAIDELLIPRELNSLGRKDFCVKFERRACLETCEVCPPDAP